MMTTDAPSRTLEMRIADLVSGKVQDQRLRTGLLASEFCQATRLAELIEDPEEAWHQAGLIPKVGGKTLRSLWALLRAEIAELLAVLPEPDSTVTPPGPAGMLHDLSRSLTRALSVMDEQLDDRVILDPPLPPVSGSASPPSKLPNRALFVCGVVPACIKTTPVLAADGLTTAAKAGTGFVARLLIALLADDGQPPTQPMATFVLHRSALSDLLARQGRYASLTEAEVEDQVNALRRFERSLGIRARIRVAEFTLRQADELVLADGIVAACTQAATTLVDDRAAFNQLRRKIARADTLYGTSLTQFLTNARSAAALSTE